MRAVFALVIYLGAASAALAEPDRFRTMQTESWPAPNAIRSPLGTPGPDYWQQKVDYDIRVALDEEMKRISGSEIITYHNNSPNDLKYLWVSIDQNRLQARSKAEMGRPSKYGPASVEDYRRVKYYANYDGMLKLDLVADGNGRALPHTVNDTFMRVELKDVLKSGGRAVLSIKWSYNLVDGVQSGNQRTGFECQDDSPGSCIYQVAQWFPRVAAYSDYKGWHLNPFLGFGSFALEMGDYRVAISVPKGHIVSATGSLQNANDVLTPIQQQRLGRARTSDDILEIVTAAEARAARDMTSRAVVTWKFAAKNVRDFAWAASRSFRWDASSIELASHRPLLMSFYPEEALRLWRPMALPVIKHAIGRGSRNLFEYPYPVFQAVQGPVNGFEYPMQIFIGAGKASDARSVTAAELDGFASVVIHEATHSWFPIMLNSDEREWSWLDEGLNSYYQYEAQMAWRANFITQAGRGDPAEIGPFMIAPGQRTPMDRPDSFITRGYEGYGKAATALSVLRSLVLGPERFDRAMKEYAAAWQFRRPTAFDFFRSIAQSSGEDLDWFWRGWFFSTDHVDLTIKSVVRLPVEVPREEPGKSRPVHTLSHAEHPTVEESNLQIRVIYAGSVSAQSATKAPNIPSDFKNLYRIDLENLGGLPSPVPLRITRVDGSIEDVLLPAEIWRQSAKKVSWQFWSEVEIERIDLDYHRLTGDSNIENNAFDMK